jgi:hypothetical protein
MQFYRDMLYMPSTTGNIAAVETQTSSQLNWRLVVRRIAGKPELAE